MQGHPCVHCGDLAMGSLWRKLTQVVTILGSFIICVSKRLLDHSWEMILLNDCQGLANKNESSCEGTHKVTRHQTNHIKQIFFFTNTVKHAQHKIGKPSPKNVIFKNFGVKLSIMENICRWRNTTGNTWPGSTVLSSTSPTS